MPRWIQHDATGPHEIKPSEKSTFICMCGLSANQPICDGAHKTCRQQEDPDKHYVYRDGEAVEIDAPLG